MEMVSTMRNKLRIMTALVLALVLVGVLAAGCTIQSEKPADTPGTAAPSDGDAAGIEPDVNTKTISMYCSRCHPADFTNADVDDWRATVNMMVNDYGAQLTPEQIDEVVAALEATY